MSFSIIQQPIAVSPAYNDRIFLANSSNSSSGSYLYVAEIKNGAGTTLAKLKTPVIFGSAYGVFNVQRILEAYINYDFDILDTCDSTCPEQNSVFKYEVEFGEDISGTETLNITSISQWVWGAAMTRRNFATFSSGEWVIKPGNTAQFLTNRRGKNIRATQSDWLYYLHYYNPLPYYVDFARYKSYNAAGSLLKTTDVQIVTDPIGPDIYAIGKVPSGRNIANIDAGEILAGTMPIIHAAAAYYTISIYDNSNVLSTEEYRIDLVDSCTQFRDIDIYYLNPMGGFDSFQFDLYNTSTFSPNRKTMKRNVYELTGTNYEYNLTKHSKVNYETTEKKTSVLNSDWLSVLEVEAMHELISSPIVFMRDGADYIPVNVINSEWKQDSYEALVSCELTIEFAEVERVQRG